MRREFSPSVRREILRAGECAKCGSTEGLEADHIIPEALVPEWKKDRPLTAADGQALCASCHRAPGAKTSRDVAQIAKAKRQEKKHKGLVKPKGLIRSRGFQKVQKVRAKPAKVMRRKPIYE
jgi:5-methylcytosine-specific restriction endonuclease McrA